MFYCSFFELSSKAQRILLGEERPVYLVEEKRPARCSGEACGDELGPVGQDGVAVGAGEEARAADVVQEDAPHRLVKGVTEPRLNYDKIERENYLPLQG